ncbi:MAG: hypothetical protein V3S09_07400, partial [Candidatus Bathyarchaeia archaeon]
LPKSASTDLFQPNIYTFWFYEKRTIEDKRLLIVKSPAVIKKWKNSPQTLKILKPLIHLTLMNWFDSREAGKQAQNEQ